MIKHYEQTGWFAILRINQFAWWLRVTRRRCLVVNQQNDVKRPLIQTTHSASHLKRHEPHDRQDVGGDRSDWLPAHTWPYKKEGSLLQTREDRCFQSPFQSLETIKAWLTILATPLGSVTGCISTKIYVDCDIRWISKPRQKGWCQPWSVVWFRLPAHCFSRFLRGNLLKFLFRFTLPSNTESYATKVGDSTNSTKICWIQ